MPDERVISSLTASVSNTTNSTGLLCLTMTGHRPSSPAVKIVTSLETKKGRLRISGRRVSWACRRVSKSIKNPKSRRGGRSLRMILVITCVLQLYAWPQVGWVSKSIKIPSSWTGWAELKDYNRLCIETVCMATSVAVAERSEDLY